MGYLCNTSCMCACGVFVSYVICGVYVMYVCVCFLCVHVCLCDFYIARFWMSGHPDFLVLFHLLAQFLEQLWADGFD